MYGYYVPAKLKGPKQLPNCLKIAEASVVLNVFKGTSVLVHYYCFCLLLNRNQAPEKLYFGQ